MASTFEHMAARDDRDLTDRLIAAAEQLGIANSRVAVMEAIPELISREITVNGEQSTITQVHAYAAAVRKEYLADERALPPGLNPGAVTDAHLQAAVQVVLGNAGTPSE